MYIGVLCMQLEHQMQFCFHNHFCMSYINSQKILPCKTATDPTSSTGVKGKAHCTQLQEEPQRIPRWEFRQLNYSLQGPGSASFLPHTLFLWILGSFGALSFFLLLPSLPVFGLQGRAYHAPSSDICIVLLVLPLFQTHHGNIFCAPV